jgi:hypothetical protein
MISFFIVKNFRIKNLSIEPVNLSLNQLFSIHVLDLPKY